MKYSTAYEAATESRTQTIGEAVTSRLTNLADVAVELGHAANERLGPILRAPDKAKEEERDSGPPVEAMPPLFDHWSTELGRLERALREIGGALGRVAL